MLNLSMLLFFSQKQNIRGAFGSVLYLDNHHGLNTSNTEITYIFDMPSKPAKAVYFYVRTHFSTSLKKVNTKDTAVGWLCWV